MSDTVRDLIIGAIEAALTPMAQLVEVEPAGDPDRFDALAIYDGGHVVLEREYDHTRYRMTLSIEGYVEEVGADAGKARSALHARAVRAIMSDEALLALIELVEDEDLRFMTAELASRRRLAFAQDFTIQFTTRRGDPAEPA
jgi:hypothetical protein